MKRLIILLSLVLLAAIVVILARSRTAPPDGSLELTWIATAQQHGPVGYRDPAGAISADGRWIAYSEGRFLHVRPIAGGPAIEFPAGSGQIRHLAWSPDSRTIVADGDGAANWAVYDRVAATRKPLWPARSDTNRFRQLAWSADGRSLAGIVNGQDGAELWTIAADGSTAASKHVAQRIAFPAWSPSGDVACIATANGRSRVTLPCGGEPVASQPDRDAYGPLAFAPDGSAVFVSLANDAGVVDLWRLPVGRGTATRLTHFSRDSYGPSAAADGSVAFKVQSYRTVVATVAASGGPSRALTVFQSETPSWDPSGKWLGVTYGTWRRLPDDAHYPDIAQDAGIISADPPQPADSPATVIHDSVSEDQSLCWSPNGQWVAFHSHKEQSDDLWLRRASGDSTARRLTMLGRGAETGWPRWSRDGRRILFTGASPRTHQSAMYIVGVDQQNGETTLPAKEVELSEPVLDVLHAEWRGASDEIVAVVKEGPGRHAILTVPAAGGTPRVVHRFASEHDNPGLAVSPDGQHVAFIAPAPDGYFQVFRRAMDGGESLQVTTDPSNKTQPSWSPDGQRIAFTVWSYDAQFWMIRRGS